MICKPDISTNKSLNRWLLVATLLFSFFSFSGFAGNTPNQHQQIVRTELVVKSISVAERAVHFNGSFRACANYTSAIFPKFQLQNALKVYTLLIKTRFNCTSALIFTLEQPKRFQTRKTSQPSEQDHPHLFRG